MNKPTFMIELRTRRGRWLTSEEHLELLNEHARLLELGLSCHRACAALTARFGFNNFARVQELVRHTAPVVLVEEGEQWDEDVRVAKKVYVGKHPDYDIWKIGHSQDPDAKTRWLRLQYVIVLDAHKEDSLHARFRKYRISRSSLPSPRLRREWYHLGPELAAFIRRNGGTLP